MEWNAPQWEWDNLVMFNAKAAELPKKLQSMEWETSADGDIEFGSLYSHGGGSGSLARGRVSDDVSSAKSSKSTSFYSSSIARTSKVTLEETVGDPNDKKKLKKTNTASSLSHETSVGSGEAVIGLKLGQRTYFEDFCAGTNFKDSSFSDVPILSEPTAKRCRASTQTLQVLCCQVDGCNLDISSAKEYHRKHKICEAHSKCPKVIVDGVERRFCQQCSRFHGLAEFDERKRSCRRRLSEHNARRRKPKAELAHLDFGRLSSPPYDGKQNMGMLSKFPFLQPRPLTNSAWDNPLEPKFTITMEDFKMPVKTGATDEHFFSSKNLPLNPASLPHKSDTLFLRQSTTKISNDGVEQSVLPSNMVAAQDIHRALSLLSSNLWSSCAPDPISVDPATHMDNNGTQRSSPLPTGNHASPLSSEIWQTEQQSTKSPSHIFASQSRNNVQFQEFQLFKASYDSGFNPNQFN